MEQYKAKMLIRVVQRIIRAVTKDIKRMRSNYIAMLKSISVKTTNIVTG